jgi:hypothetical protein
MRLLPILIILLFASGLYLADVQRASFWEDESWMVIAAHNDLPSVWRFATERGVHPPLYFLLGWLYTRLAGDSELALRWLAGLWALIGIAWTYRLGAAWVDRRTGQYGALLAAGSLFLIYFARLSRQYTLFFALAPMLVWFYHRWSTALPQRAARSNPHPLTPSPSRRRGKTPARAKALYSALSTQHSALTAIILLQTALLYTHYFGFWMGVVLALAGFLTLPRRDGFRLLAALVLSGVLFIPWLPSVWYQLHNAGRGLGYATRDWAYALRAYTDRIFNGADWLGLALLILGLWVVLRRWNKGRGGWLLVIWLTVPLGLSLLINTRFSWFIERNMIFTLSGVCILFGAGLAHISHLTPRPPLRTWGGERLGVAGRQWIGPGVALVAALTFVGAGLAQYETFWGDALKTPDWRGMARAIVQDSRPDDTYMIYGEPYSMTYYLRRFMGATTRILSLDDWLAHKDQPERIWLMDANWAVRFEAIDALPKDAVMTRRYVLGVLVTEFYQRAPSEAATIFGEQIALGVHSLPSAAKPGEGVYVDLWWRALRRPDTDYSVGVYLVAADGRVVAQHDGGFDRGQVSALALPLDKWTPDARLLQLPTDLPPGDYSLTAAVYDWRDGVRLPPIGGRADGSYALGAVRVGKG